MLEVSIELCHSAHINGCDERRQDPVKEYELTLVIAGNLDDSKILDALYEAGCDDATFGTVDGVGYGDFQRQGSSISEALRSAIEQVESVPPLHVLRAEPDDLVTMNEIAERLGRSRESARLLIKGTRGPGGFPAPVSHLKARSRLWRWSDVAAWSAKAAAPVDLHAAAVIAALNAALTLRENAPRLSKDEKRLVWSLV